MTKPQARAFHLVRTKGGALKVVEVPCWGEANGKAFKSSIKRPRVVKVSRPLPVGEYVGTDDAPARKRKAG